MKGELPFRYLGFPLASKRLGIHDYKPIVDKITDRILHWTSRKLSMAGRVQFVNNVIQSMQSYWAQVFCLSRSLIWLSKFVINSFGVLIVRGLNLE